MDPIEAQKKKLEEQAARRKSGEIAKPVRPVPASTPEPPSKATNPKVSPLKPATGSFAKPQTGSFPKPQTGSFAKPAPTPAAPPGGVPRPAPLPTPPAGIARPSPAAPPTPVASAPPPRPAALPTPPGGIPRGTPSGGTPRPTGAIRPRVVVVVREKTAGGDDLATEVEERLAATKRWILGG